MYEVFLKSWYQEKPKEIEEEIVFTSESIDDAWDFLKMKGDYFIEYYPLLELGIRVKIK